MFLVIISGSAAFADLYKAPKAFAAIGALCGAIDLLWAVSDKARDHEMLHRRYSALLVSFKKGGVFTAEFVQRIHAEMAEIGADEPPYFRLLNADCHNQIAQARMGSAARLLHIPWYYRPFMHSLRFPNFKLREVEPRKPKQPASNQTA